MAGARIRTAAIAAVLALGGAALYGWRLSEAPPHLEIDEVLIGLDAHAIATTGRDLAGARLPLYSQTATHSWYQPLVIYVTALALKLMPLSERAVRLPTVCIGVLNILLMYAVARRLFASEAMGVAAAALLALTPAHFLHSRYAMDYMYPVTFVLAWLLCLVAYAERPRAATAVAAAAVLGVGFYSYISAMALMPLYFAMTCVYFALLRAPRRDYGVAAVTFAALLVPFAVWVGGHPLAFGATLEKYGGADARNMAALQGIRQFLGLQSVSDRAAMYWNMLSPSVLFLTGGSRVMFSTGRAGVFLLPLAVLLAVGLYEAAARRPTPIAIVLVLGFLTAPLPALLVTGDNAPIFRALTIVPFGVLLAVVGVRVLWNTRVAAAQLAVILLLALGAAQFPLFWSDYFGAYRVRASEWLGGNIGGALETIIACDARRPAPAVYFNTLRATSGIVDGRDPYMLAYWKFYAIKHGREDLVSRTRPLEPSAVSTIPAGSFVLANVGDRIADGLVAGGQLKPVATIRELDGTPFFEVLER